MWYMNKYSITQLHKTKKVWANWLVSRLYNWFTMKALAFWFPGEGFISCDNFFPTHFNFWWIKILSLWYFKKSNFWRMCSYIFISHDLWQFITWFMTVYHMIYDSLSHDLWQFSTSSSNNNYIGLCIFWFAATNNRPTQTAHIQHFFYQELKKNPHVLN